MRTISGSEKLLDIEHVPQWQPQTWLGTTPCVEMRSTGAGLVMFCLYRGGGGRQRFVKLCFIYHWDEFDKVKVVGGREDCLSTCFALAVLSSALAVMPLRQEIRVFVQASFVRVIPF